MAPPKGKKGSETSHKDKAHKAKTVPKILKRKRDQGDLATLQQSVNDFDVSISSALSKFSTLPLSEPTKQGVDASHYTNPTDIQAQAIPIGLKGLDILGAAKTGSGKTLAFVIPVLEKLYREQWTEHDGLGALIISPTRELAAQIFKVLCKIGRFHSFSAGVLIGGKSLKDEAEALPKMNILVATPGRLLQHLDQTVSFCVDNLQILVLDEADRCMDMGFQKTIDAIAEHLPTTRQTFLFSATQSRKVSDLARLSLKDPQYVSVHEAAAQVTPDTLEQMYTITPLAEKLNTLWGFIKANLKTRMIVFWSSGKQVRFAYEVFRKMRPGISLLHLHGRQKQFSRLEITQRFRSEAHVCLFATDVIGRGIDFPNVDWVVQADAPEDVDTYIHRVGRAARAGKQGKAVLFLDPSEEEGMKKRFEQKKVPIRKASAREKKKKTIQDQIQDLCFHHSDIKYLGQKAFISYIRAIARQDKAIFNLVALDLEAYSASLGLPEMPPVKIPNPETMKKAKNKSRAEMSSGPEDGSDGDQISQKRKKDEVRTKYDKMFERQNQDVLSTHYSNLRHDEGQDDQFFFVRRVLDNSELEAQSRAAEDVHQKTVRLADGTEVLVDSKRMEKKLQSKKEKAKLMRKGVKTVFDDDGNAHAPYEFQGEDKFNEAGSAEAQRQQFVDKEASRVAEVDRDDKLAAKERRREKRAKRKEKERLEAEAETEEDNNDENDDDCGYEGLSLASYPGGAEETDERPRKKARKQGKVVEITEGPETLEDLEAVAADLLDD